MSRVTVDMLRVHLMAASLTAMGAEVAVCLALLALPISEQAFSSVPFRLFALAVVIGGVLIIRHFARVAFDLAIQSCHATPENMSTRRISVAANCPRRRFVILHLRFTGRPFVLGVQ